MKNTFLSLLCVSMCVTSAYADYLAKPTGEYHVGYRDYHWVNQQSCPDPLYIAGKNDGDYSGDNVNHCREIVARIYYPTHSVDMHDNHYFRPSVDAIKSMLRPISGVTEQDLQAFDTVSTYSSANQPVVSGKQFPVVLFAPGYTDAAQEYENQMTDLVSHGYIVIGINSSFINLSQLPSGHVIPPRQIFNLKYIEKTLLPVEVQDIEYVYELVHNQPNLDEVFNAMDTRKIGGFGHSLGSRAVARIGHVDPQTFSAIAMMDIGIDSTGNSTKAFTLPIMNTISANRKTASPYPAQFELGKDGYVVGMSPSEADHEYSQHMNFSDMSTMQYMTAYVKALPVLKKQGPYFVGYGDGNEISHSTNTYVRAFFDMYLKGISSAALTSCKTMTDHTYIQCG